MQPNPTTAANPDPYKHPSLSQTHQQLLHSKTSLLHALHSLPVTPLTPQHTKVQGRTSIESVIKSIPPEQTLVNMVQQATRQQKADCITSYAGEYRLVRDIQKNIVNAKPEAIDTYYLITQVKPQHLRSTTEYLKHHGKLFSCNLFGQDEKIQRFEKNAFHERYRQEMKAKERAREAMIPPNQVLQAEELMVHVTFYDSHIGEKQNQFVCYGRQPLTQLRDKFYCLIEELQPKPTANTTNVKSKSNSSFIFIDNIFYNDLRHSRIDISQPIITKAKSCNNHSYISLPMQKTLIKDLRIELGRPYIYRHLQGCDHMLVFSDLRLFNPDLDLLDSKSYPVNIYEKRLKRRKCEACDVKFAALVVLDDKMKNGEHGYYCQKCHMELHLDDAGETKYRGMIVIQYLHD